LSEELAETWIPSIARLGCEIVNRRTDKASQARELKLKLELEVFF